LTLRGATGEPVCSSWLSALESGGVGSFACNAAPPLGLKHCQFLSNRAQPV
jgi:hypothetical protein